MQGATTENSTMLNCQAQLELKKKKFYYFEIKFESIFGKHKLNQTKTDVALQ